MIFACGDATDPRLLKMISVWREVTRVRDVVVHVREKLAESNDHVSQQNAGTD